MALPCRGAAWARSRHWIRLEPSKRRVHSSGDGGEPGSKGYELGLGAVRHFSLSGSAALRDVFFHLLIVYVSQTNGVE
ncbi:Protein Mono-Adp-Ribosyltransferase Parp15 [Manis pentadactyla]|nr:Protein Mono-Adp-Ribosyltransferase Parp15 [Manis pentadactyla]